MKERIKRGLTAILLALTALFALGAVALAEEAPSSVSDSDGASEESISEGENLFADIFSAVESFSTEILCALSFVGSLIIAFAYKKGLLPAVKSGIGAIGSAIGEVREQALKSAQIQEELTSLLDERLALLETTLTKFDTAITEIAEKTESGAHAAEDRENVKALMSAQIDMLYELFMTSSLPQYQKDALSERIRDMKEVKADVGENG